MFKLFDIYNKVMEFCIQDINTIISHSVALTRNQEW